MFISIAIKPQRKREGAEIAKSFQLFKTSLRPLRLIGVLSV